MNYIVVWINERVSKERVTDSLPDRNQRISNRTEEVEILMRGIQSLSGSQNAQFRQIGTALLPFYQMIHINKSADEVLNREIELNNMQNLEEQRNGRLELISAIRGAVNQFPNEAIKNHFIGKFFPIAERMESANANASAMAAQQSQFQSLITRAEGVIQTLNNDATNAQSAATDASRAATTAQTAAQNAIDAATGASTAESDAVSLATSARTAATNAQEYTENAETSATSAQQHSSIADNFLQNTTNSLIAGGSSAPVASIEPPAASPTEPFTNNLRFTTIEGNQNNTTTTTSSTDPTDPTAIYTTGQLQRFAIALAEQEARNMTDGRLLQASELLTQKDTIANNILMDYMYTNEKGTTVNSVVNKLSQVNNDKKRKLEINTYYNKSREKYISILKVIVLACILLVPLVIANKNKVIPNIVFMFAAIIIIFFTIVFIFSSFADIYKRDNLDFDKIKVPYDREARLLEEEGAITRRTNPLTSLTLTCVGADCCDSTMSYDQAKNRCIETADSMATENFDNVFDNFASMNNSTIVYPYNTEGFINNTTTKNTLIQNSLSCSGPNDFISQTCQDQRIRG
jgi:hypothetical protein